MQRELQQFHQVIAAWDRSDAVALDMDRAALME